MVDRIAYENGVLKIINDTSKFSPIQEDPTLLRKGRLQHFLRKKIYYKLKYSFNSFY